MKRALLCSAFAALLTGCGLCPSPPSAATGTAARYPITDVATAPATPVRNQAKSGTCWAFGGVSLIESEAIRTRRCTLDLSEMWVVRHAYFEKAVKYVRTRGRVAFDQGGEIQDVLWLVDRYGIVPQSLYEGGAADGTYDHASLAKAIRRLAKRIVDKKLYEKEHWQRMIDEELDRRLGARPDRFVIDGGCLHAVFLCRLDRLPAGRLRRVDLLHPPPFFRTVRAGNSRQLGGARDT